jgi:Zn-dependent protease with chaperone function
VAAFASQKDPKKSRRVVAAAVLCASLSLGACGDLGRFQTASSPGFVPVKPNKPAAQTPATEREHSRILSSYGGSYDDPRLEALITKTVDRLVAASERPDLAYKVTILNSGAVNAFALPTGQLYVTRGLIALASDTSELSSVLAHEMAHVLAKHAAIREDQAKQAAVVTRVVADMGNDADMNALALAKTKLTMASFSRAQEFEADGIGVGIAARAKFDPFGASRFLTAMERNAALKAGRAPADPRSLDFLSSHPATPERVQNAQASARQFSSPEGGERDRDAYLSLSTAWFTVKTQAKVSFADDVSCIPSSASPSRCRKASCLRTPHRPWSACAKAAHRQCASMWCVFPPNRLSATISIPDGWRMSTRRRQKTSASTASHPRRRPPPATSGNSESMPCASGRMCTASFLRRRRKPTRVIAASATR